MSEQKRRGRPPKDEAEAITRSASDLATHIDGDVLRAAAAQAYADRVWAGQSISMSREWRIERVKAALEGQGLPFDGVELPE